MLGHVTHYYFINFVEGLFPRVSEAHCGYFCQWVNFFSQIFYHIIIAFEHNEHSFGYFCSTLDHGVFLFFFYIFPKHGIELQSLIGYISTHICNPPAISTVFPNSRILNFISIWSILNIKKTCILHTLQIPCKSFQHWLFSSFFKCVSISSSLFLLFTWDKQMFGLLGSSLMLQHESPYEVRKIGYIYWLLYSSSCT